MSPMPIAHQHWPQLLDLVEQALDLPSGEREHWLNGLSLEPTLLSALRGLLEERHAIETGDFLQALPPLSEPQPRLGALAHGTRLGPWRLVRLLGEGGMSAVWLAERADEQVQRQVALKLPHAGPGQDVLAARLLRERNILAGLEHRNIARLYDVGVSDQGVPFLVMEFVPGQNLLAYADAQGLTVRQRLALFQQVLRAVQYAHGKLVLHRDLKPSNILVNEAGDVKLLDFGIAKVMDSTDNRPDSSELTQAFGHRLTPSYASPEQLRGEPLGTASDVYSLGVVLYELLCGVRPFERTPDTNKPAPGDAKAPSRRTPAETALMARACNAAQLRKALAGDLDAIALKCLSPGIPSRYASVDALSTDLARHLAHLPISATAPSAWYTLSKFVTRHRWGVSLGSLAASLLLLSSGAALLQSQRASQEAQRAIAAKEFLLTLFAGANVEAEGGKQLTAQDLLARGRKNIEKDLAGQPLLQAELLMGIAEAQRDNNDLAGAQTSLETAGAHWATVGRHREVLDTTLLRSAIAMQQRRYDAAAELTQAAQTLLPSHGDEAHQLKVLNLLANVAMAKADYEGAYRHFSQYLSRVDQQASPDVMQLRFALLTMADLSARKLDAAAADGFLARALKVIDHSRLDPQDQSQIWLYRSSVDMNLGRYSALSQRLPEEVQRCESQLGPQSRRCWRLRSTLATIQLKLGLNQAAALHLPSLNLMATQDGAPDRQAQALALAGRIASTLPTHSSEAAHHRAALLERVQDSSTLPRSRRLMLNTLAEMHLRHDEPEQARQWAEKARAIAAPQDDPAESMKTQLYLGMALSQLQRHQRAREVLGPLCQPGIGGNPFPPVLAHLFSLNCLPALSALGEASQAQSLLSAAAPVLERAMGADSPTVQSLRRLQSTPPSMMTLKPLLFL